MFACLLVSHLLMPVIGVTGFPHDLRPSQRHGSHHELDWNDAPAVPLGRLPSVPGAHAAGLPSRLLGHQEQDGGKWATYSCSLLLGLIYLLIGPTRSFNLTSKHS